MKSLTASTVRRVNLLRGLYGLLVTFSRASWLDYREGCIICPATYSFLLKLGGYGFSFTYHKEFGFVDNVDFIMSIKVEDIVKLIFEIAPNSNCYVTFQKEKRKK